MLRLNPTVVTQLTLLTTNNKQRFKCPLTISSQRCVQIKHLTVKQRMFRASA